MNCGSGLEWIFEVEISRCDLEKEEWVGSSVEGECCGFCGSKGRAIFRQVRLCELVSMGCEEVV